ncbi:uncharacterized protein Tco025E_08058 [Trypanosoma conorhini]|uniref:Uncharacterized protein n=1 Tax=Trypanosoma conorhini TaxID=83891 RepID=A0A3S5IR22_9TRYP|nr:uncharacterized protein Tco025E_08058 [Trypanosoma conorhini]RNF03903.1 hypothetical protein Tco025E_08058 [Trypanosoma conorhini]
MSDSDTAALAALQHALDACEGAPFQPALPPPSLGEGEPRAAASERRPAPRPAAAQPPTVRKRPANDTAVLPRVSSPDRLRLKTYRLQKEFQALSMQHERRHERLQSIRARQSPSRSSVWAGSGRPSGSAAAASRPSSVMPDHAQAQRKKERGPTLPNLLKCFEDARTRYLLEGERRKKAMPPVYSSQIPRAAEAAHRRQSRDIMKDPDAFGLRFFSQSYLQEAGRR